MYKGGVVESLPENTQTANIENHNLFVIEDKTFIANDDIAEDVSTSTDDGTAKLPSNIKIQNNITL